MNEAGKSNNKREEKVAKTKAYQSVLTWVEEEILNGRLKLGNRLPGERDLATNLGVSRAAVREAIRVLEAQGVVRANVGTGPLAGTHITSEQGKALARLLQIQVSLANIPSTELLEIRISLEKTSVALAAAKADAKQLAAMLSLVNLMDNPDASLQDFNHWDTKFHVEIAKASNNHLLADLTGAIRQSLHIPIQQASTQISHYQGFRSELVKQHRKIYEAIANKDAAKAMAEMEKHIRWAFIKLQLTDMFKNQQNS